MGYKMKGFSGFGNSPAKQTDSTSISLDRNLEKKGENDLLVKIEDIRENANAEGKPLSDAQKSEIAAIQKEIENLP